MPRRSPHRCSQIVERGLDSGGAEFPNLRLGNLPTGWGTGDWSPVSRSPHARPVLDQFGERDGLEGDVIACQN